MGGEAVMALDPTLAEILACPADKGSLYYLGDSDELYNPRLGRIYEIADGIPVLLIDAASVVSEARSAELEAKIASGELQPTFQN